MFLALHSKLNRASRGERERERMKLLKREPGDGSLGSKKLLDLFPPLFPSRIPLVFEFYRVAGGKLVARGEPTLFPSFNTRRANTRGGAR